MREPGYYGDHYGGGTHKPGVGHGGATREPVRRRGRVEAVSSITGADAAHGPRGGVSGHRGLQAEDRRPGPGCGRDVRVGAEERGPEGLPWDAGGGQHGHTDEAAGEGGD